MSAAFLSNPTISYDYPSRVMKPMERSARGLSEHSNSPDIFGLGEFEFSDLLDVVNPLQHLPGVAPVYRASTGDTISTAARLAGGALLGGPVGFAIAAIDAGIAALTGEDIGGHVVSFLTDTQVDFQRATASYSKAQAAY